VVVAVDVGVVISHSTNVPETYESIIAMNVSPTTSQLPATLKTLAAVHVTTVSIVP
jgi:uncharacterized alkaline shock family protein YloU